MRYTVLLILQILLFTGMIPAQGVPPDSTARQQKPAKVSEDDAKLRAELAKELGVSADSTSEKPAVTTALQGTASRLGSVLNPRISVIGSFLGSGTENGATVKSYDVGLSEVEASFQAYVDPYSKADFFIAFGHESEDPFTGPDSQVASDGELSPELEEGYLTSLSLPFALQVRAGKFRSNFGKINPTHPHALNFLDVPRMYVNFLGEEGLSDRGIGINYLVPNPLNFYQELSLEITSGAPESPSFEGGSDNLLYLAHLKNFFDLNDNSTLEVGLSGIYGANDPAGHKTRIGAADLTYKWKPLRRNRYQSFEWITEGLVSHRDMAGAGITSRALFSYARYQLAKRWFLGARFDYSEFPDNRNASEKGYSGILSFFATEFQKLEIQYQHGRPAGRAPFNRLLLRAVFVIGAHGAHQY